MIRISSGGIPMSYLLSPTNEEALANPEDYFFLDGPLADKIGYKASIILTTLLALSDKQIITNQNIINTFDRILSTRRIKIELKVLEELNLISMNYLTPEEIVTILRGKKLDRKGIGTKKCNWCGCNSFRLHSHHYPISKAEGGKEVIDICSNCHLEYHYLFGLSGKPELYHYDLNFKEIELFLEQSYIEYENKYGYKWQDRHSRSMESNASRKGDIQGSQKEL
jgi:hypothetical protein